MNFALLSGTIKALLAKQVTAPVLWEDTMQNMIDGGYEKGYELGPGKVVAVRSGRGKGPSRARP